MPSLPDRRPVVSIVLRRDPITLSTGAAALSLGWVVLVGGRQQGGKQYRYLEALDQASRCARWTDDQVAEWTGRSLPDFPGA